MLARDAFESRIGAKRTGDQQEKARIENFVGGLALRGGGEVALHRWHRIQDLKPLEKFA